MGISKSPFEDQVNSVKTAKELDEMPKDHNRIKNILENIQMHVSIQCNKNYIEIHEAAKKAIIHYTAIQFFLSFIIADDNCVQTTTSFAKQKYTEKSAQKRHKTGEDVLDSRRDYVSSLDRIMKKLRDNIAEQNEQAKRENSTYKRFPYKKDNKREYNFLDLNFAEMYYNHYLMLYDLLFYKSKPLEVSNKKDALREGYEYFNKYLNHIKKLENKKEFVISCLQFFRFEIDYRFVFFYKLAKYMKQCKYEPKDIAPLIDFCICKIRYYDFGIPLPGTAPSPFIANYEMLFNQAFNFSNISDYLNDEKFNLLVRSMIQSSSNAFYHCYSLYSEAQKSFSDADYDDIADFLINDFQILTHLSLELDNSISDDLSHYEYVRALIMTSPIIDIDLLEMSRQKLQKKQKARNKRK